MTSMRRTGKTEDSHHASTIVGGTDLSLWKIQRGQGVMSGSPPPRLVRRLSLTIEGEGEEGDIDSTQCGIRKNTSRNRWLFLLFSLKNDPNDFDLRKIFKHQILGCFTSNRWRLKIFSYIWLKFRSHVTLNCTEWSLIKLILMYCYHMMNNYINNASHLVLDMQNHSENNRRKQTSNTVYRL